MSSKHLYSVATRYYGYHVSVVDLRNPTRSDGYNLMTLINRYMAMASVMSTVLSRLNAFLDSELEQVLCFDSAINAEQFAAEKSAIFLILPEEDTTKNFMAGLMIQTLARELFAVADENGGRLPNRVVFYCDELKSIPKGSLTSSLYRIK